MPSVPSVRHCLSLTGWVSNPFLPEWASCPQGSIPTAAIAELINEPWILAGPETGPYKIISEALRIRGLSMPKISLMTLSVHLRTNMVASGHFITTFPHSVVRLHADRFSLKVLPVDLPARPWPVAIVTLKNRALSPIVERFIGYMRDFTRPMRERQPNQR